MQVTKVQITLPKKSDRLLAFVTVIFDECFIVRNIRLIQGANGRHVAMPDKRVTYPCSSCGRKCPFDCKFCPSCGVAFNQEVKGTFSDVCHPLTTDFRQQIEDAVFAEYDRIVPV